jgi:hypothetical protein
VGFTAYYVWNTQNNKKEEKSEVASSTETEKDKPAEEKTPAKVEQKYLVIKEWGVKIPIDDKYSDLVINRYCENDKDYCAFIYSPTQINLAKSVNAKCYSPESENNLGSVVRYKDPNTQYMGTTMGQAFSPNKKLGDWYYGYKMPNEATCQFDGPNNLNNDLSNYYANFEKDIFNYINSIVGV